MKRLVYDCRKKTKLVIGRLGGDLVLKFIDIETGKVLYEEWFELKEPRKKNYEKVKGFLEEIQKRLKRQDKIGVEESE